MYQEAEVVIWNELTGKLRQKYPFLTNADLQWRHTSQEDVLDMIASKLGLSYKELKEIADQL